MGLSGDLRQRATAATVHTLPTPQRKWGSIREEPPRGDPWKHAGSTADFGQCRFRMANASRRADERETNTALKSA